MFRKVIFRLHLSVAVAAGLFIATMAVTGVVIACEDAVMSLAERRRSVAVPEGARRLPPSGLLAAVEAWGAASGVPFTATSIEYRSRPGAPVQVHWGPDRRVFVDPWTGEVVGGGFPLLEGLFESVRGWHRWLGASGASVRTGRAVTGAANLAFLFLLLTGPLLWIPLRITPRTLAENLLLRRRARGPARHLNRHYVIGIWSVLPLALISATGVVLSYPAVGDRVYAVVGTVMPREGGVGAAGGARPNAGEGREGSRGEPDRRHGLAGGLASAGELVPGWRGIRLEVPRPDDHVRVEVRTGRAGQPQKTSVVMVDRVTGAVLSLTSFHDETPGHRAQEFLRHAHTGEYWGLAGQVLAGIFALAAVVMVWTGFSVAFLMFRRWRPKRRDER